MRCFFFPLLACLSFGFIRPSLADDLAPPPQGALYLGQGQMLEAARPRQVSINANVLQFDYQPGGLEIAYTGWQIDGNKLTQSLRLVGLKRGTTLATLLSQTAQVNDDGTQVESDGIYLTRLQGWSGDGRYLLVAQDSLATIPGQDEKHGETNYLCIDVGQETIHMTPIALPPDQDPTKVLIPQYWWSPDRSSLLLSKTRYFHDGDRTYLADTFATVYDPAQNRLKAIALPDKAFTRGWLDGSHILIQAHTDTTAHYISEDLTNGSITEIAKPTKMPRVSEDGSPSTPAVSPKSPLLELEDEAKTATDEPKTATAPYHALWVRRTKGNKPLSAMPVGLTPGDGDTQARWSPTGKQIAFIAHGDLFITDLSERDATGQEKLAAGETLTCAEEREVASSNLKQIGLGIIQYAQDNDEKYPAEAGVKDTVMPYLKDESLFNVGGHPFVYHAPADLSMANLDAPADTVLGTMNLPCAQVVLYADGHVKTLPKGIDAGTTLGGAGR